MKSLFVLLTMVNSWMTDDVPGWPAYLGGEFYASRDTAAATGTADGMALACRSGLVIGGFLEKGDQAAASLHRALDDCTRALDLNPGHVVAATSYAIALGYEAKRLKKAAYAKASKKRLEALLETNPDDAVVVAAFGGWHSAVSSAGLFARLALGASRKEAGKLLGNAVALDPGSVGIRYEYVRFLAKGGRDERAQAITELEVFFTLPPRDAAEMLMQRRMVALLAPLKANDKDALKDALTASAAFADIDDSKTLAAYPLPDD